MRSERLLQLDCGNSSIKWRLLEGERVALRGRVSLGDLEALPALGRVDAVCVASVQGADHDGELSAQLQQQFGHAPWFAHSLPALGPLRNSYQHPERMGVDRWLAMLAAYQRVQGRCCVIDAGSALTIDLVASDGQHEGGYIIPGAQLMEAALLQRTGRVRFAESAEWALDPGCSTADAVRHGIALALAGAVRLSVERSGVPAGSVLFSGGYGALLAEQLGYGLWYEDLVFEGLGLQYAAQIAS
jgi:type III pantothenate kinase